MLHGPCGSRNGPDEVFGRHRFQRSNATANGSAREGLLGGESSEEGFQVDADLMFRGIEDSMSRLELRSQITKSQEQALESN